MRVLVLGGSPKGPKSITLQYARYLEAVLPEWELEVVHVAQRINALERGPEKLEAVVAKVREADLVLLAFPLYFMLVCSQFKRFFELIEERGLIDAFADKPVATLSTSIKFFDHVPHQWLRAVTEDWGMRPLGWWSAHMQDLMDADERERLVRWARELTRSLDAPPPSRLTPPMNESASWYRPGPAGPKTDLGEKRALILHDATDDDPSLRAMVDRLAGSLSGDVRVRSLHDIEVKGGCLGCCRCGLDNECAYQGRDGFKDFFESEVRTADVLVFAGAVRVRQLSATWRRFFDRSFYRGHAPSLLNRQHAFLVSGPLSGLPALREPYEVWVQLQHGDLVGWVSDEGPSDLVDQRLDALGAALVARADAGVLQSEDFRGLGGRKLFRDEIWGPLRPVFQADHKRYKELGYYDFPQRDWTMRIQQAAMLGLIAMPGMRARFPKMIRDKMVEPHEAVVAEAG